MAGEASVEEYVDEWGERKQNTTHYTRKILPEPIIAGSLNKDYRPVRFLLDTGSERNLISFDVLIGAGINMGKIKEDTSKNEISGVQRKQYGYSRNNGARRGFYD